ncbi:hypothetical protein GRI69_09115 [Erythrobacter vulgaris]|uniref:Lipoprotein n=1 Tax=Qipengyuania vulgaris TaxID=291985 RepID=A0A844XQK3_9SPHN|nr:hypothetical protein [Qipengyuania vulgaris]MXO48415.1 hypothetical protein [Qipengyuania vulgaris]
MRWTVLALPFVLLACDEPSPAEEEAARQQAVAEVKANQKPPPEELVLDPIRYPEIEKHDLFGAGCSFVPDGGGLGAVAIGMADKGYMIRKGELMVFAADMGSAELPYLARRKYDGREFSFSLDLDEGEGTQIGYETTDYRGTLTVTDGTNAVVYKSEGLTQCGA